MTTTLDGAKMMLKKYIRLLADAIKNYFDIFNLKRIKSLLNLAGIEKITITEELLTGFQHKFISNRTLGQFPFAILLLLLSLSAYHRTSPLSILSSGMLTLPKKSPRIEFIELSQTFSSSTDVTSYMLL